MLRLALFVLFKNQDGEVRFPAGDDDSGLSTNAQIKVCLFPNRRFILCLTYTLTGRVRKRM